MTKYQIQRIQPAEWKSLRSIRLRSLADSPDAFGSTLAKEQQLADNEWRRRCEDDRVAQFLAMTTDCGAIGIAVGAPYRGHEQTAGLFGMWVAPEARKHGIGAALVEAVIAWAESEAYQRVILDVGDTNTPAIRLYESCGFVPTGETGTLPPPRQHIGEYRMERILADDAPLLNDNRHSGQL